jgi:TonB family protein
MRTFVILVAAVCFVTNGRAQSLESKKEYFDSLWLPVSDARHAAYYRTIEHKDDVIMARDYFISGKIQMIAECSEVTPKLIFNGNVVWYYENGTKKSECSYKENEQIGLHTSYYENGAVKMKRLNTPGKKGRYIQYMSPAGQELLIHGNGTVLEESSATFECYTVIEDSIALATFNIDRVSRDTTFAVAEKSAEFKGGLEGLARYLQATVKYPKQARRSGAQGTVLVAFIVDKDGTVKDSHIIRTVDPNCDAVALKAVSSMDRWTPAEHRGVPVKSRFVLPVKFRLTP